MGDVHYMISEAARRIGVESHVLRNWEEELNLSIDRTEMGHRHYTEDDIQLFSCIKELKEQGMLLKEIKNILPDMLRTKALLREKRKAELQNCSPQTPDSAEGDAPRAEKSLPSDSDIQEIQDLFGIVVRKIISDNNPILEEHICKEITEKVAKDMDFLLQAKDRLEEERYRKLDHLIRQQQTLRKESARSVSSRYLRKLFGEA